jgi:4-amino-4-deoxy-L-arabinose transferase-like glycosyltransferase
LCVELPRFLPKITIFIILFCGALLRIPELNGPISYDEAYSYIAFVRQPWLGMISDYSLPNNHIFHNVLVKISTGILGNHPWSLRLPAFFAGMAAILLIYVLGRRIFNLSIALTSSALVAGLPAIIHYDIAARGYSLVSFFTLLAWLLAMRALETGQLRFWLTLALSAALGIFTIPIMVLPAGGIYLWLLGESILSKKIHWPFLVRWLGSGVLALVLSTVFYLPVLVFSGWRRLLANSFVAPIEQQSYFLHVLWRQLEDVWDFWNRDMSLTLSLILVLGIFLSLAFFYRNANTRLHLAVPMLFWISLYVILRRPNIYDRFLAFLLAPAMLWAAAGLLTTLKKIKWQNFNVAHLFSALSVLALLTISIASLPSAPQKWRKMSNVQAIAIELQVGLQPGDMVLAGYPFGPPLWYYLSLSGVDDDVWQARNDFERAFILASIADQQTPESVIRSYGLQAELFDLEDVTILGKIGRINTYLVMPASP